MLRAARQSLRRPMVRVSIFANASRSLRTVSPDSRPRAWLYDGLPFSHARSPEL